MIRHYARPAGLVYGPDARQLIEEGRGASLGGLSAIAYTLVEEIARGASSVRRRFATGRLPRQTVVPAFLSPERPLIMGIVNVTPDSFSDGGLHAESGRAIAHGLLLAQQGADILDVGGESTRPGSEGVPEAEELRRILPVIEALAARGLTVSVDTRKANVMRAALQAGASIVNDVAALTYDPAAIEAMAEASCPVILMHAQGDPRTMQLSPHYDDVALDVFDWLEARIEACVAAGIARWRIVADPGIGFGKSFRHNIDVLRHFTLYHSLGVPVLMGLSRKGFIGALTGEKLAGNRVSGSVGGAVWSALNGAHIIRVHDVKATVEALAVAGAAADPDRSGL
ncbi:dihydropteroate synthase [Aestuariivirga sp.]|uniref:dihydropteroate synthase n=1 Tax=Aestuariivirga sp. TaxID=2650926 RepID=UPI0025C2F88C|nr:dihydropteroate synthase [Aestuariivirga sp.]MCA3556607.1 dihydropteroate synthase [Aestuariivirga sp.]